LIRMMQAHIFYSGRVQGVGFRYTVQQLARPLKLYGWVRNLADGQVELTAQGAKEKIEELLSTVEGDYRSSVTTLNIKSKLTNSSKKK
jgi:acylphosphatase